MNKFTSISFFSIAVRFLGAFFWVAVIYIVLNSSFWMGLDVPERSLTILSWYDTIDRDYVKKFEQETGIKIYLSNYTSNEELLVKLRSSGGRGYDLVVPSDYAVKKLLDDKLLMKLDRKKLPFFSALNPLLLGHPFDPSNEYTIPFEWELYVVGINTNYIEEGAITPHNAWDFVFKPQIFAPTMRMVMVNDPVEAICLAARYLFGTVQKLSKEQLGKVQDLLIAQRKFVEAYNDVRADYFLCTNEATLMVGQTSSLWRAIEVCDKVDFVVPHETFISIENCAIPIGSTKQDLTYQFLDFLFSHDSYQHHFQEQRFFPARLDVIDYLPASERQKRVMRSSPEEFANYYFMQALVSDQEKNNLWVSVKS